MTELLLGANRDAGIAMRELTRAALLIAAVVVLNAAGGWLAAQVELSHWVSDNSLDAMWIGMALVYVLVMALPFVPGIEIGLAMMLLLGDEGILLVYLCTQAALAASFIGGRLLPASLLAAVFRAQKIGRAQPLLACLQEGGTDGRLACLVKRLPAGWVGRALKHRYLTLAGILNLPGNAVIGGAGGIGLIAGASRLFSFPRYCLLMAVATSPVPVLLLLRGAM